MPGVTVMLCRRMQDLKFPSSIFLVDAGMMIDCKFSQPQIARAEIRSTPSGIVMVSKSVQFSNAWVPMALRVSGSCTECRTLKSEKALSPMEVTPLSTSTLDISVQKSRHGISSYSSKSYLYRESQLQRQRVQR